MCELHRITNSWWLWMTLDVNNKLSKLILRLENKGRYTLSFTIVLLVETSRFWVMFTNPLAKQQYQKNIYVSKWWSCMRDYELQGYPPPPFFRLKDAYEAKMKTLFSYSYMPQVNKIIKRMLAKARDVYIQCLREDWTSSFLLETCFNFRDIIFGNSKISQTFSGNPHPASILRDTCQTNLLS